MKSDRPISFNPRTRTGCDRCLANGLVTPGGFNPRTRTGCDEADKEANMVPVQFQSTHPHGVRLGNS